ncbi:MAG: hypothetical protein ACC628_19070, partial [Pirellulaceae bacterium]
RANQLAESLCAMGVDVTAQVAVLNQVREDLDAAKPNVSRERARELHARVRRTVRHLAFANPLLDFDDLLFVQRAPSSYAHMSDQYFGWFSRPGGGLFLLEAFQSQDSRLRCLTTELPEGNILRPDLSYDGRRVLFAFCRYYPELAAKADKMDKSEIPEDAFYHLYEVGVDGTGLRRLTSGNYDDMDGRYLPDGRIVFLSTRRGQFVQCNNKSAAVTRQATLPDSYMRCGGSRDRPVAVYTLHVVDRDGRNLRPLSSFESFEWNPSVANDGRILYTRWDYVDRDSLSYMSLWSTLPDGSAAQAVYGNYTVNPFAMFEPRAIPHSNKLVFTASAQHSITGGSLVLLDPSQGADVQRAMTRLTPEVPFPESEDWPQTYYANPFPLSEQYYLVAWSDRPLVAEEGRLDSKLNPRNAMGLYLYDAFGNRVLIYRNPDISSMYPLPVRARAVPPRVASTTGSRRRRDEGRMLVMNVYQGLEGIPPGSVRRLRIVGLPPKIQPVMNFPQLGVTEVDAGKFVLGTVPVEEDGSAYFRVPADVPIFLQALDADGMAVQTMRSATYVPPNQTYSCVGCHEPRTTAPANVPSLAAQRKPSRITPGPEGSWPLDFSELVQPVLDRHCVSCHKTGEAGARTNLTTGYAYSALISHGEKGTLQSHMLQRFAHGFSTVGACGARSSGVLRLIRNGHYDVSLDKESMERLVTWMDTYAQREGSFGPDQERQLRELRQRWSLLLTESK